MYVILFFSNNHAVWCKDYLTECGINCRMISVPRELSSDCGYCVKINTDDIIKVRELLKCSDIEIDRIEKL